MNYDIELQSQEINDGKSQLQEVSFIGVANSKNAWGTKVRVCKQTKKNYKFLHNDTCTGFG